MTCLGWAIGLPIGLLILGIAIAATPYVIAGATFVVAGAVVLLGLGFVWIVIKGTIEGFVSVGAAGLEDIAKTILPDDDNSKQ
jgi:hypothetical protein